MKITKFKIVTGAAIAMFLLTGTVWADGNRGGKHRNGGHGYRQHYHQHPGPNHHKPVPYKHHRHFRPKYDHRYYHQPRHHHPHPVHGPRHHHLRPYYGSGYGLHLSIFDPFFTFGFSTGGHR